MLVKHIQIKICIAFACICALACLLCACSSNNTSTQTSQAFDSEVKEQEVQEPQASETTEQQQETKQETRQETTNNQNVEAAKAKLNLTEDYRSSFVHGEKPASAQKYIMLHDTEGDSNAQSVINYWEGNGKLVAAHFIVNKDGSIWQCVPLDKIAHHAGFGNTGHNAEFGVEDESRDDKAGTVSIGSSYADYGMNSYSIGIEMVHVGGSGDYPAAQLEAVDNLIAYIDAYYGFQSQITDHKAWRSGNSDTSAEFATYLSNYKTLRHH